MNELFVDLPEADKILQGLEDLARGHYDSRGALLVTIAAPRLRRLGLDIPPSDELSLEPELMLYHQLCQEVGAAAYVRYNALLARLVSFEQALERRVRARRALTLSRS